MTASQSTRPIQAKLENGLDIVVIPDHRAPVVTHMVWYRNGSADDPPGKSGIAHFLEHLMFKGTAANPAGRFSAIVADLGGQENAFTSVDFTAYFQSIPRGHLAVCMEYEADRMKNLVLADSVVAPERDVVLEERRMRTDSDPGEILNEAMLSTLHAGHPYGRPVIGWQHEIETLDRQDALDYYARFYAPENAILVVAGDVEPAEVIALATEIYGPIAPFGEAPKRRRPRSAAPTTRRQVTLADARVEQPRYQRMHAVPSYATGTAGSAEALEVLSHLLGGAQTSALFRSLVMQDKIADSVGAYYLGVALDETRLCLYASPAPGVPLERLEAAIGAVLARLAETGFDPRDVARAKTRLVANAVYTSDSQMSLAQWYGMALTTGMTVRDVVEWADRIEAVTADDLQRALALLEPGQSVSGYLIPAEKAA